MPLSLPVLPMTIDEFHVMEHRLGWKHEYWDGAARLSCQPTAVASWKLDVSSRIAESPRFRNEYEIRNVALKDRSVLVELFVNAFDSSVEYAGWSEEHYESDARRSIESFFGNHTEGACRRAEGLLDHSFLAYFEDAIVAAILVRRKKKGPTVEPIMVDTTRQRNGLGSALLQASVASLRRAGARSLFSRCHLANTASLCWHNRSGFREQPEYFSANHRASHFHWQADHYRSRGLLDEVERANRLAEYWSEVSQDLVAERTSVAATR